MRRPIVKNRAKKLENPHWLAGFTSAEGCYMVKIQASKTTHSIGFQVRLEFVLTQHSRDEQLMKSLIKYYDCGNIYKKGEAFDLKVTKIDDIQNKIPPPPSDGGRGGGVKALDFADFMKVA